MRLPAQFLAPFQVDSCAALKKRLSERTDGYLDSHDFAEATRRVYGYAIRSFLGFLGSGKGDWVARAIKWKDAIRASPATKALYLAGARGFLRWCVKKRLVDSNPLEDVRIRRYTVTLRQALTTEEVRRLLETTRKSGDRIAARDYTILVLMLHTGVRVGAVGQMCLGDFERASGKVILRYFCKGHSGKDSFVVLPPAVVEVIEGYLSAAGRALWLDKGPLFAGISGRQLATATLRKVVTRRLRAAGINRPGICVHSLRHTAATTAIAAGADLLAVRDMLGHKSVKTTEQYVHSINRIEDAAELRVNYGGRL